MGSGRNRNLKPTRVPSTVHSNVFRVAVIAVSSTQLHPLRIRFQSSPGSYRPKSNNSTALPFSTPHPTPCPFPSIKFSRGAPHLLRHPWRATWRTVWPASPTSPSRPQAPRALAPPAAAAAPPVAPPGPLGTGTAAGSPTLPDQTNPEDMCVGGKGQGGQGDEPRVE